MAARKTMAERRSAALVQAFRGCAVAAVVLLAQESAGAQSIVHVSARASGGNNGSSWEDALVDLQDALAVAQGGDEIWVAAGIYRPSKRTEPDSRRTATFLLKPGVAIYGGFAGWETQREQRNPLRNETILSGDLTADDDTTRPDDPVSDCCAEHEESGCDDAECEAFVCARNPACCRPGWGWIAFCAREARSLCCELCSDSNRCENSYHVVTTNGPSETTLLDGLTITGGNANFYDLEIGVYHGAGGAVLNEEGDLNLKDCTLHTNSAVGRGGAIYTWRGRVTLTDTAVSGNWSGRGGGLYHDTGELTLTGCTLSGNDSGWEGGAAFTTATDVTLSGCALTGNSASSGGAQYHRDLVGSYTLINCAFVDNLAQGAGGAVYTSDDTTFLNCVFSGNVAGTSGGGIHADWARSTLINCVFNGNFAGQSAGGIKVSLGNATFYNCSFNGNSAELNGGGVFTRGGTAFVNCAFSGNVGGMGGGGLDIFEAPSALRNCTFSENTADFGGGIAMSRTTAKLTNCILWGNRDTTSSVQSAQLRDSWSTATVNYSIIQGWTGNLGGMGNTGADPLFVDADGWDKIPGTDDDDLRLTPDSPSINRGDPTLSTEGTETDLDGAPRIQGCRVDMGAYESDVAQLLGDYDGNERFDLADFAGFQICLGADATEPGLLDACLCVFDFDGSESFDLHDYADFRKTLTGP